MFRNFCTNYAFFSKGIKQYTMTNVACFSKLFSEIRENRLDEKENVIEITMRKSLNLEDDERNNLIVGRKGMYKYLIILKKYIKFSFKTIEDNDKQITLRITHNGIQNELKYLLTFIRFLYEDPYCYALSDALKLYDNKKFKKIPFFDFFHMIVLCIGNFNGGHYLVWRNCYFKSNLEELKEMFRAKWDINSSFGEFVDNKFDILPKFNDKDLFKYSNGKKYFDESRFNKRLEKYLQFIDIYKKM